MRPATLTAVLVAITLAAPAVACDKPASARQAEAEVISLINSERARHGLGKVRRSEPLEHAAARQACDLAARKKLSHVGTDGSTVKQRVKGAGYAMRFANENIGYGFRSPASAVAWWMNSPGHRKNILEPRVREIGVSLTQSNTLYWATVMGESR